MLERLAVAVVDDDLAVLVVVLEVVSATVDANGVAAAVVDLASLVVVREVVPETADEVVEVESVSARLAAVEVVVHASVLVFETVVVQVH